MPWTYDDEKQLALLKQQAQALTSPSDSNNMRSAMAQNPEVAETPYGKGPQQGLEHPVVDPVDLAVMAGGPGLVSKGVKSLAELTGASQIPGRLMSSAVGTRYIPKIGQTLVDEGLIGTKGILEKQVAGRMAQRGQDLTNAVESIPSFIPSKPVADEVGQLASKFQTPGGQVPDAAASEFQAVRRAASDIAGRGNIPPSEALSFKRIAAEGAYSAKDKPLPTLTAQLGQAESNAYGKALEGAYAEANPGEINAVQQANAKLSALFKAKKGLGAAPQAYGAPDLALDAAVAGGSAAMGHSGAGIAGILARHAAQSPLVKSAGAQIADKAGAAIASPAAGAAASVWGAHQLGNAVSDHDPASSNGWGEDDEKQLQALKEQVSKLKQ